MGYDINIENAWFVYRKISDGFPPHLQIWSFAWLALPLFKQLLV